MNDTHDDELHSICIEMKEELEYMAWAWDVVEHRRAGDECSLPLHIQYLAYACVTDECHDLEQRGSNRFTP